MCPKKQGDQCGWSQSDQIRSGRAADLACSEGYPKAVLSLASLAINFHNLVLNLPLWLINRIRKYFTWKATSTYEIGKNTLAFSSIKFLIPIMYQEILFLIILDKNILGPKKERETVTVFCI